MGEPLITVRGLAAHAAGTPIVRDVSFSVVAGEVTVLFGPSGEGKTTVARAAAGLPWPGVTVTGAVASSVRVGYLPQHAAETLNPARRIGGALGELVALRHPRESRARRRARVAAALRAAAFAVPEDELGRFLRRFPFEFSGGQRTRLALAQVLATEPEAIVLDEPASGLDALSKNMLVGQLDALARGGAGLLLVTHDADVVRRLGGRVLAVRDGTVHPADAPSPPRVEPVRATRRAVGTPVVELRDVSVRYGPDTILSGAGLTLFDGEALGVVGASGAGKSSLARCLAGLLRPSRGAVLADGRPLPPLRKRSRRELTHVQYVWQEAASSFDPRRGVREQVAATAVRLRGLRPEEAREEAGEQLAELGLTAAQADRRPPGLSGGQLRRAALARALLARPRVLVCDELTTGLDEPLSARILDVVDADRKRGGGALISISHDLPALSGRVGRVMVVGGGRAVEHPDPDALFARLADRDGYAAAWPGSASASNASTRST